MCAFDKRIIRSSMIFNPTLFIWCFYIITGNNIKTPDKKGRIENHRRSDDSFIECAHNEYQKMEEKRLRKKDPKKNN